MNILPINSNQTKMSFEGSLSNNRILQRAMEQASDYELMKFSKVLPRMSKTNDGRIFSVSENLTTSSNPKRQTKRVFLHCCKGFQHTFDVVGEEWTHIGTKMPDNCYAGVIGKITSVLEKIYPEPKVTAVARETSLNKINKYLV